MKRTAIWPTLAAVALICVTPALAQQVHPDWHGDESNWEPVGVGGPMRGAPTMDENPYYTAKRYIDEGEYARAIPYLDEALRRRPGNTNVLAYEGYALGKLADYSDAMRCFDQVLKDDPDNHRTHEYLGEMYLVMHRPDDASRELAALTKICTDGCDEKDALTKAIADYRAKQASATPPPALPAK